MKGYTPIYMFSASASCTAICSRVPWLSSKLPAWGPVNDNPTTQSHNPTLPAGPEAETRAALLITSDTEHDEMYGEQQDGQRQGSHRCVEIVIEGWPEVGALPRVGELKDLLNVQEGFYFNYQDIMEDRRKLEL